MDKHKLPHVRYGLPSNRSNENMVMQGSLQINLRNENLDFIYVKRKAQGDSSGRIHPNSTYNGQTKLPELKDEEDK